jgi:hypothetical protein
LDPVLTVEVVYLALGLGLPDQVWNVNLDAAT